MIDKRHTQIESLMTDALISTALTDNGSDFIVCYIITSCCIKSSSNNKNLIQ